MSMRFLIDPWGEIHETIGDGLFTGNIAQSSDPRNAALRPSADDWRYCERHWLPDWGPRPAEPPKYTRLFFLDEPTALSAGHRPCCECLPHKYRRFLNAWRAANSSLAAASSTTVCPIDAQLHRERLRDGSKLTYLEDVGRLPDGAIFQTDKSAFLKWQGLALQWSIGGYVALKVIAHFGEVHVLTPRSVVRMLAATNKALVLHPSAHRLLENIKG